MLDRWFKEWVMFAKYRRWILVVLVLAVIGWVKFSPRLGVAPGGDAPSGGAEAGVGIAAEAAPTRGPVVVRKLGQLAFSPCTLAPEFGTQTVEAQCGRLLVPENHAVPSGRKISLAIAWLPAKGEAKPDPVFMLAGGPGQSALEAYPATASAYSEVNKTRDVILVDQRGTGGSNRLICKDSEGKSAIVEDDDYGLDAAKAFAARCATELSKKADLRFYSTSDAIQDLEAVRVAIGAAQINLSGGSYGTRVGQQYAKRYPAQTRTLTIDGIVPNTLILGNEHARNLESSLDSQFDRCVRTKGCVEKLGNPRARLNALMAQLRVAPPMVRYRDAITGEAKQEQLTAGHVATLTRMFAYAPAVAGLLPLELNEAAQGRYESLMALSKLLASTVGDQIMHGMQLSVICTEDAAELQADPADAGSLLGVDMINLLKAQCEVWPQGKRPADFRRPLTGAVPVLILSGEFDPVTPPRYGDVVQRSLPNSRHLVLRGQGHNTLGVGCMPKLFARFLDSADARKLDATCLDKLPYAVPFTGFYGWEP
ncbi:MAG: alpha/beta hydrolase [Arenimonas sp.]|jgi:pimeloyl-ACP methyl ester carboxylesterase